MPNPPGGPSNSAPRMSQISTEYARDANRAEKASGRTGVSSAAPDNRGTASPRPRGEVGSGGPTAFPADFHDNVQLAITKFIEIAMDDTDYDVRRAGMKGLISLVQDNKLQAAIIQALPKSLDSVFRHFGLRSGWGEILDTLSHYDVRLGGVAEPAISILVEMAVRDDDDDVRHTMVKLLASLAKDAKFRDASKSALAKKLDSALKDHDWQLRIRAIKTLTALVPHSNLRDAVKSAMPQLLKVAVDDEDEDARAAGVELLEFFQTGREPEESTENKANIGDAILLAVPLAIALITPEGHDIRKAIDTLLRFSGAPTDPEPTAISMARVLTPMLKGNMWLTRATAVEFLAVLNKYTTFRQFIQSEIPEIITLALDGKEDDVRAVGIRSLVNLAGEKAFRDKIKTVLPQLVPLLEVNRLRGPVVELISLLAVDKTVRKDVLSRIIDPIIALKTGAYPDGLLELLSRLIIDKRFSCQEASDRVMLSVASVLLMRPQAVKFRLQTVTALWCNYGDTYAGPENVEYQAHLVELFLFTLFGRHVTPDEVKTWRSVGSRLLLNQAEQQRMVV